MKTERLKKDFDHFILQKNHPCVMAQSVIFLTYHGKLQLTINFC